VVLGVTHIHAHEHLRPVLSLGATRAGVDFKHSAHRVGFLLKHVLELQVFDDFQSGGVLLIHFFLGGFAFLGEIEQHRQVVVGIFGLLVAVEPSLHLAHLLHGDFGGFRVTPKLRVLGLFV
jgi:hypothetical protein